MYSSFLLIISLLFLKPRDASDCLHNKITVLTTVRDVKLAHPHLPPDIRFFLLLLLVARRCGLSSEAPAGLGLSAPDLVLVLAGRSLHCTVEPTDGLATRLNAALFSVVP